MGRSLSGAEGVDAVRATTLLLLYHNYHFSDRLLGLRVPHDVALIGFDDFEIAALLHPRLTLVRQPAAELGRRAAELLFERLDGRSSKPVQRVVLATELIVRESCGCRHE